MKKEIFVGLIAILLLATPVFAQQQIRGIFPDNPLYFLDKIAERIQMFLTFDKAEKVKLHMQFVEERIEEVYVMEIREKPEFIDPLVTEMEMEREMAEDKLDEMKALGQNITALEHDVYEKASQHTAVLERVKEMVPEQHRGPIEVAIDKSQQYMEHVQESVSSPCYECGD